MTSPFPQIQQGPVIQDPGLGGTIAQALAQVLAQQQAQKEQEWRQQQLQHDWANQQAQLAVSQGNLAVNQGQLSAQTTEAANRRSATSQVGGAIRQYLTGGGQQPQLGVPQQGTSVPNPGTVPGQPQAPPTTGVFQDVLQGGAAQLAPSQGNPDIFGGVSDENLPAAVQGVQEVQKLQPQSKEPELPTSAKEFLFAKRLAESNPALGKEYMELLAKPSNQMTTIVGQGESQYSKDLATSKVKIREQVTEGARTAMAGFPMLNEAYRLAPKSITGLGANQRLSLARVVGALGGKAAKDDVVNTQTFLKLTGENALTYLRDRALGSGTAVSDADREFTLKLSAGQLTLDPKSIQKTIRINVGIGVMRIDDAINVLRDQAISYPENAAQANAEISRLEKQRAPIWQRYTDMLQAEDMAVGDIRKRLRQTPGIQLP